MSARFFVACDLGAESGRVVLGALDRGLLQIEEVHRCPNGPVPVLGSLRWELLGLYGELLRGLRLAGTRLGADRGALRGISVDSWGVDYVLGNARQPLLGAPYCYRDPRTRGVYDETMADPGAVERIYAESGVQFMAINTLYQLRTDLAAQPGLFTQADFFLGVADFMHYLLCGVARWEESLASTTQLYHPGRRAWSQPLRREYSLPEKLFPAVVPAGTTLGPLDGDVAREAGLTGAVSVVAGCSHDTGAAVAAVPAAPGGEGDWAYLISGTWSLLGLELTAPRLDPAARAGGFTNELGLGGTVRFLKNIAGLWLLQEARRDWADRGESFDYARLVELAAAAEPFRSFVHPNAPRFEQRGDMLAKLAAYCRETDQPVPATPGEVTRCVLESLALLYRQVLATLEAVSGRSVRTLHVVGGGSRNGLLNQLTADALGRPLLAGPVEATAIGNLLIQALADGVLGSHAELRAVVARSFPAARVEPRAGQGAGWERAAARFAALTAQGPA